MADLAAIFTRILFHFGEPMPLSSLQLMDRLVGREVTPCKQLMAVPRCDIHRVFMPPNLHTTPLLVPKPASWLRLAGPADTPATANQIHAVSQTWAQPFASLDVTQLTIAAWSRGVRIEGDRPENTFALAVGDLTIYPDHGLTLVGPYGRRFLHYFEFDRSTETLRSELQLKSTWKEKNIVYDGHQNMLGKRDRFRVVPVTSESRQRLANILHSFAVQTTVPNRELYVGVHLPDILASDDPLCDPSRADIPEAQRRDFFLYVDEFQNFVSGSFAMILSEARKYRLLLTLAHQYLGQLQDTRDAIFGNVGTTIAFSTGYDDADMLARAMGGGLTPSDLVHLPKYHSYVALMLDGKTSDPFLMRTLKPSDSRQSDANLERLRSLSRQRYAVPVESVDQQLQGLAIAN